MKIENQEIIAQYYAGFPARGPAQLSWPSGTVAQLAHASRHYARTTRSPRGGHARWRGRRVFAGGLGVARLAAQALGWWGEVTGQEGYWCGSPRGSVMMRWWMGWCDGVSSRAAVLRQASATTVGSCRTRGKRGR
jgi:hypothetical protein